MARRGSVRIFDVERAAMPLLLEAFRKVTPIGVVASLLLISLIVVPIVFLDEVSFEGTVAATHGIIIGIVKLSVHEIIILHLVLLVPIPKVILVVALKLYFELRKCWIERLSLLLHGE